MKSLYLAVTAALIMLASNPACSLENPEYDVLYVDGKIEYRLYQSYLVAETFVSNDKKYTTAANTGFMRLFNYITGDNQSRSKIAMTSPVQQAPASEKIAMTSPVQRINAENGWTIAFMLPKEYRLETAPKPDNDSIRLRQVPSKTMATLRYSGRWTESNYDKHSARLLEHLRNNSIEILSEAESAIYNPPFTPPFMRRNEIMIEVSSYPAHGSNDKP